MVTIFVDADSFPRCQITEKVAESFQVPLEIYHNYCVEIEISYGTEHIVEKSKDSADFAILNSVKKGDIVCTNDLGLSSLAISKGCQVVNAYGQYMTKSYVAQALAHRHMVAREKRRRSGKGVRGSIKDQLKSTHTFKHFDFEKALVRLVVQAQGYQNWAEYKAAMQKVEAESSVAN